MARVFVSHAGGDLGTAEMIAGWLRAAGHRVFLDRDLEDGLRVGDVWSKRLFEELYQADALVAVVTVAFGQAPWCAAEVGIALANGVRLLPVRVEPGVSHRLIGEDVQCTVLDSAASRPVPTCSTCCGPWTGPSNRSRRDHRTLLASPRPTCQRLARPDHRPASPVLPDTGHAAGPADQPATYRR